MTAGFRSESRRCSTPPAFVMCCPVRRHRERGAAGVTLNPMKRNGSPYLNGVCWRLQWSSRRSLTVSRVTLRWIWECGDQRTEALIGQLKSAIETAASEEQQCQAQQADAENQVRCRICWTGSTRCWPATARNSASQRQPPQTGGIGHRSPARRQRDCAAAAGHAVTGTVRICCRHRLDSSHRTWCWMRAPGTPWP
jgi:hypothetical protein